MLEHELNHNLNPPVFDHDFVEFKITVGTIEARAGADVEAPAVPVAFDGWAAQLAVGEGRAAVGAEVFRGVEFAAYVVERELFAAMEFDGRAAARRHVFDATDNHCLTGAVRASGIEGAFVEGLHCAENRNKLITVQQRTQAMTRSRVLPK